ncbi:hypothetical protein Rs2_23366 [Raphanus sativus]|nr:hypothetical protein Rs2_23366 [Raphanus sativus]
MSEGNRTDDGDRTLFKQQETSQISSFLNEFPAMTIYADAESALAFLRNREHEINLVIWDFHMPGTNGIQALKIICTEMDLPVLIMSDDDRTTSVMEAMVHGACYYVTKPVRKEVLANIWQHIVRKRMMPKLSVIPPVQLDGVHNQDSFKQDKDDPMPVDQGNSEQNINMIGENLPIQSDSVQSDGLDQDNNDSRTTSPYNGGQNIDGEERRQLKKRMEWTRDLEEKFHKAIDDLGGAKKANPKRLLKRLEEMNVKGLTRRIVCSHLQKYRLSLQGKQTTQPMQEFRWSRACTNSPLLDWNNVHSATSSLINGGASYPPARKQYQNGYMAVNNNNTASSSLMTGRATYPVQDNQYQNGYMEVNNNNTALLSLMSGRATYPVQDNQYQNGYMEVNNNHAASPSLMNGRATYPVHENQYQNGYMEVNNNLAASSSNGRATYPVQDNQYQNGYLGVNNNQVMTNTMPRLPYDLDHDHHLQKQKLEQQHMLSNQLKPENASSSDIEEDRGLTYTVPRLPYDLSHGNHLQQQQEHQLPHRWNNVMSNNEPELASGNGVTGPEGVDPSLPYDPNELFINGYNYNQ